MQGRVLSIQISPGGIPKLPIPEAAVTREGIRGDGWAHPNFHGGANQALLLIGAEAIAELAALGYPVFPGALGENLTTEGLDRRQMRPRQRFRIGETLVEITKLRTPCATIGVYGEGIQQAMYDLAVKAGKRDSPKWGMGGFYAFVVTPGTIRANDIITLVDQAV